LKVLYIHAKKFFYKPREKVKLEAIEEADVSIREFENTLVSFVTIEAGDFSRREEIYSKFIDDLISLCKKLGVKNIVIYPYAHLSENLEKPQLALRFLRLLDNRLRERLGSENVNFHRAPFGWYKEFMIHCLGHPLAELSRHF